MPNFGKIFKLLKYAPTVIGLIKQLRGAGQAEKQVVEEIVETRNELENFKKQISARLEALEAENGHLKTRLRQIESSFTMLRVLVYPIGVFALISFILAIIALIMLGQR